MSQFTAQACLNLRPNAAVTTDSDGIHWHHIDRADIPSSQEIASEIASLQAAHASTQYQRDRAAAYPDYRDYLDGIVKGDQVQVDAYIAACRAVKARYPK